MSLPTPPSTGHRDKENRFSSSTSRVVWSSENEYHCLSTPPKPPPPASASKEPPAKSILKKCSYPLLPLSEEEKGRETTPAPLTPLEDPDYLAHPVATILSSDASLRDLIEAYSLLSLRIKACVSQITDPWAKHPFFQPFRDNLPGLVEAFNRDIARALVDPTAIDAHLEDKEAHVLPSPQKSPRKKGGFTEEQVKYARDLCTTSHAVMKFLVVSWTLPAAYMVFSNEQLGEILTQVLALPIANRLPTPNARKTWALAIGLIQIQRLPEAVLWPAKDRIAYALRRGVEGELGKEGKKGSAGDGMKAIHDLSMEQPQTFIPAFTEIISSVLSNLTGPTLTLRSQACNALGGFVLGYTSIPATPNHSRVSDIVVSFLLTPTDSKRSPTKKPVESAIVRTLRTTLLAVDPQHAAQGPVWALVVLAEIIVLLGPKLCTDRKLLCIVRALLSLTMRHKKSSIRVLSAIVWRCLTWAYFQPPYPPAPGEEEEDSLEEQEEKREVREEFWKLVISYVDIGNGVSMIAAALGNENPANREDTEEDLQRIVEVLANMVDRGGKLCREALVLMNYLVSYEGDTDNSDWLSEKLLVPSLFSSLHGLLAADYRHLVDDVRPILEECPSAHDLRTLTRDEITKDWMFTALLDIWKEAVRCLDMPENAATPIEVLGIWRNILKNNVSVHRDADDDAALSDFAVRAVDVLIDILTDFSIDLTSKDPQVPSAREPSCKEVVKLLVLRDLWLETRTVIPNSLLRVAGQRFLDALAKNESLFTHHYRGAEQLTLLCAEILPVCDIEDLKAFWVPDVVVEHKDRRVMRSSLWMTFAEKWRLDIEGSWKGGIVLLGVPFMKNTCWDLSPADYDAWDFFLYHTMNKALDYGIDAISVLDDVAATLSENDSPIYACATRVVDNLLSRLDMFDARHIPESLFKFTNSILVANYPPEAETKLMSLWMIRPLTRVIDLCPLELALSMLELLEVGLCTWISDEQSTLTAEEYDNDILPLYQTTLLRMQGLPLSDDTLNRISAILESAFCGRADKPDAASEAFADFWAATYADFEPSSGHWPARIQHCLGPVRSSTHLLDLESSDQTTAGLAVVCEVKDEVKEERLDPESEDEKVMAIPIPASPAEMDDKTTIVFGKMEPMPFAPLLPALQPKSIKDEPAICELSGPITFKLEPPSTPTKLVESRTSTSTPLRPHKPFSVYPAFPFNSPTSPVPASQRKVPTTPKRTPRSPYTPTSGSTERRRKLMEDKENESPHPLITSVMDRIAMKPFSLGKRRLSGDCEGTTSKRVKIDSSHTGAAISGSPSSDSEDERTVVSTLFSGLSSKCSDGKRKRAGVFMDVVEVPTLREAYGRLRSSRSLEDLSSPSHRGLRLVRSTTTSLSHTTPRKRRKYDNRLEVGGDHSNSLSSSSVESRHDDVLDSDESFTHSPGPSSELSSDDDPHIGQVTPHHLISPALHRSRKDNDDPPSDDSIMSSSPTRDVIARRMQRAGQRSFEGLGKPIPLTWDAPRRKSTGSLVDGNDSF